MSNARLNNASEILESLSKIYKFYVPAVSPVVDSVPGALAVDDVDVTVTTFASFSSGDYVLTEGTGGMDLLQLGTKPGSAGAIPLVGRPVMIAQDAGAVISVATRKDLGYIEDAGATLSASASKSSIGAANARGPIAYLSGDVGDMSVTWGQRESSLRNILSSFGIDEDSIRGTGVTDDPYRCLVSTQNLGSQRNHCYRMSGLMINGKTSYFDILNAFPEVNISANIVSKGSPTVWTIATKCTDVVPWIGA